MIQRLEKLSFRYKITILVFLVSIIFYMAFILIEDLLVFAPIFKNVDGFESSRRGIRLAFGMCFSVLIAIITAFSFNLFYDSLNNLIVILQNWNHDSESNNDFTANDELGDLARSLKLTIFQERENAEIAAFEHHQNDLRNLASNIQSTYSNIQLKKMKRIDASVFPSKSKNPNMDYFNIIPNANGCLGMMAGFEQSGINENSYKARLHGIMTLAEAASKNSHQIQLKDLILSIELNPTSLLNAFIFDYHSLTGELSYTSWKLSSGYIINEQNVRELESGSNLHVPFGGEALNLTSEIFKEQLEEGETFVLLSDQITSKHAINRFSFISSLKRELSERKYRTSNSRETSISIAKWVLGKYGKKSLEDLGIIAIRRPFR